MRYKLTIEYLGTGLLGWQRVKDGPSVQAALEEAAFRLSGEKTEVTGAGRTDAGVHAFAQAAHVDFAQSYPAFSVMQALNYRLHAAGFDAIAVTHAEETAPDFHARFNAVRRRYCYRIINRRARLGLEAGRAWHIAQALDTAAMQKAAQVLVGHHDFTSFRDSQCQAKSPMKTLETLSVERLDEEIRIHAAARSFLHHQVRIIAGTLAQVGLSKWSAKDVEEALAARNRAAAGPTAPPEGLYLIGVEYS